MTKKLTMKYKFEDNYTPRYVTGVYGGIMPTGDLCMHFFLERVGIINKSEHEVSDEGQLNPNPLTLYPDPQVMLRQIEQGIILNPTTALTIFQWYRGKLNEMGFEDDVLFGDQSAKK